MRSTLAAGSAALAYSLGGVLGDPGGSRLGHGSVPVPLPLPLPLLVVAGAAAVLSLVMTRKNPLRAPLAHVAVVTLGCVVVGAVSFRVSSAAGGATLSVGTVLGFLPSVAALTFVGLLVTARSLIVAGLVFFAVDTWIVARAASRRAPDRA